jgi:hypothetical protein
MNLAAFVNWPLPSFILRYLYVSPPGLFVSPPVGPGMVGVCPAMGGIGGAGRLVGGANIQFGFKSRN